MRRVGMRMILCKRRKGILYGLDSYEFLYGVEVC